VVIVEAGKVNRHEFLVYQTLAERNLV